MPSLRSLVQLFDKHASGELSDYEVSTYLHRFDGAGVLPALEQDSGRVERTAADSDHHKTCNLEEGDRERQRTDGSGHEEESSAAADASASGKTAVTTTAAAVVVVDAISDSEEDTTVEAKDGAAAVASADAFKESKIGHEMTVTSDMDTTFPPPNPNGLFCPSSFQKALLSHVTRVRQDVGHCTGLLVMATALGKTVFCILDIHRQFVGAGDEAGPRAPAHCQKMQPPVELRHKC